MYPDASIHNAFSSLPPSSTTRKASSGPSKRPRLDRNRQPALHGQRQTRLADPVFVINGRKLKQPRHRRDNLHGNGLGHLLAEAGPGAPIKDGVLGRTSRDQSSIFQKPLWPELVGVVAPGQLGALHGPDAPNEDRVFGQKGPVRECHVLHALSDLEGDGRVEAKDFVKDGHGVGHGDGRKKGRVEVLWGWGDALFRQLLLDFSTDLGHDGRVSHERVKGPCQGLAGRVSAGGEICEGGVGDGFLAWDGLK